jgi:porin
LVGPFDSRPNDSIGFGIANYVVNDRAKDKSNRNKPVVVTNMMRLQQLYSNSRRRAQCRVELYLSMVTCGHARPNLQYIHQPAGVKEVDDAWVQVSVKLILIILMAG